MSDAGFRFVDLFAGIGGFHAAMSALGGECVYAVEIDPRARRVYRANWGMDASGLSGFGDIRRDNPAEIPDHEVLCAGFPCQPFSKSGAQRGMDEARGTLFYDIAKIIEAKRPLVVMLENVRNLAGPRHAHEWDVIIATLRDLGYHVSQKPAIFSPHLLPRHLGGTPQVRERVFITATRSRSAWDAPDPAPVATMKDRFPVADDGRGLFDPKLARGGWHLGDVLADLDERSTEGYGLSAHEGHWLDAWDEFVRLLRDLKEPLPGFPVWAEAWRDFEEVLRLRFPSLKKPESPKPLESVDEGFAPPTLTRPHIDTSLPVWKQKFLGRNYDLFEKHHVPLLEWAYRWGVYRDDVFPLSRRKLEWQAQDTESVWQGVIQLRPSGIRVKRETYLPALVAMTQTSIVGRLQRRIAPWETARLQGLPDTFVFPDQTDATTYKQLGNGVAVGAVSHVFRAHLRRDEQLLLDRDASHLDDSEQRRRAERLLTAVAAAPLNPHDVLRVHEPAETSPSAHATGVKAGATTSST